MAKIYLQDTDLTLWHGDVLNALRQMESESVDCVVTSPPYWGLRDYGTGSWGGGDPECEHVVGGQVQDSKAPGAITAGVRPGVDSSICRKCGAHRIDEQIGLESTPEAYVEKMVEVFREVRRVLAPHGTVWLNLGDSYNSNPAGKNPGGFQGEQMMEDEEYDQAQVRHVAGTRAPGTGKSKVTSMKPKDLVGIPWMVAKALQAPYYTGKIRDERDRIWLAATVEAEGCLFIHRRKAGQSNGQGYVRKNDSYGAGLEVSSTDRVVVERCLAITGLGSISEQSPEQNTRRKQTIYRWNLRSNVCREVIRELYPHFIAKQHEARLLLGCPSSGDKAKRAHESLKALHQGGTPDIDFAAPEPMFEGGWYLRSDIIWSKKPNPMPESITDRPTKAHEYVFLLAKNARYFFDQEAVREPAEWNRWGDQTNAKYEGTQTSAGWIKPRSKFELEMMKRESYPPGHTTGNRGAEHVSYSGGGMPSSHPAGRNIRTVWTINTQPYAEAHFATFPEELPRRAILAGCPENGVVLDPFAGSGTTALVARKLARHSVLIELNADYCQLIAKRLQQLSLFA